MLIVLRSGCDAERLKYGVDAKQLQLLGLVPMDEVPRHLFSGRPECVVATPEGASCDANMALQALLLTMADQGLVAMARYAARKGAAPQLVAMWPACTCFWMVPIPFSDEVKNFDWGSSSAADNISDEQLQAACNLIDAFDLMPKQSDEEEALKPKRVFNPKLQRSYQCIGQRARTMICSTSDSSSSLPPPDPRIANPLTTNLTML